MLSKLTSAVAAVAGVAVGSAGQARGAVFTETFDDGLASGRWSVASQQEATRDPSTGPDGSVNFSFDYSTLGIAAPSGSTGTIGAFVQVNNTDQVGDEGETYVIFPSSYALPTSGYWRVDADMFVWNDGAAGTTELGMIGAYMNPAVPVAPYQWGDSGGPLAWIYSGEGGSTADLAHFSEGTSTTTGYSVISDYNAWPAGTIPGFETGVAGSGGPAGDNPAGSWVDIAIEKVGDDIIWYLNGVEIDRYTNAGFYSDGTFFLGTTDPFNSSNAGGGAVIDNVLVTVPEPSNLALYGLGAASLLRRRRHV